MLLKNAKTGGPLFFARLAVLLLAWSWAIVGVGVGLNALVKSNQLKTKVKHLVPAPTIVDINDHDVFQTGVVATVVSALIGLLTALFILIQLVISLSSTALKLQGSLLGFCTAWLFATLVPFTHYYATRSAHVTASIGGTQLPQQAIQSVQHSLGISNQYKDLWFLRLVAILPWFTFLFTLLATLVLFMAAQRDNKDVDLGTDTSPQRSPRPTHETTETSEKAVISSGADESAA
ncbi:hypothetical protein AMATHDRAFT_147648 [Amanita thiersii Skay4041]|uniref:MARVEL domain-containing protein n=1 Tax=Amanita thiersii Skay4041 TaxID=703135 RepID=A0A2A9NEN4_9AGAR|nr:hypothetical protein AMATHDRAFT_147648 [Amanita thiersii Skay4041]